MANSVTRKIKRKAELAVRKEQACARRAAERERTAEREKRLTDERARRASLTPEERHMEDRSRSERLRGIGATGILAAAAAVALGGYRR
jgi:hypothetical protein